MTLQTVTDEIKKLKQEIEELKKTLNKVSRPKTELEDVRNRLSKTFWSILAFNYILVSMGVVAFILAAIKAVGGEIELATLFGALGTADVVSLFKFSMDRVQRSLGDQVQLVHVNNGHSFQMECLSKVTPNTIDDVEKFNEEARRATVNSMQLVQDFTKIAEPINKKPWIRAFPIRYRKLKLNGQPILKEFEVKENQEIELSGSLFNSSKQRVKIKAIVIAMRPPGGTPDGGPFRFDFYIDEQEHTLLPRQSLEVKGAMKKIVTNARTGKKETVLAEWYRKDWYAFMTCQTEDGCWQDDHNKYWFELKK